MPRLNHCVLVLLGTLALFPGAAIGQEEGVTVDPDSSSAKEYALPFEEARRKGSKGDDGNRVRQGDRSSPAFGEGVERDTESPATEGAAPPPGGSGEGAADGPSAPSGGAGAAEGGSPTDASGGSAGAPPAVTAEGRAALERAERALRQRQASAGSGDLDATTAAIIGGGGVLLLAGFGGIALRRLRR